MDTILTVDKRQVRKDILVLVIPILMESVFRYIAEIGSSSLVGHLSALAVTAQGISIRTNSFLNVMWSATRMGALVYYLTLVGDKRYLEVKQGFKNISTVIVGIAVLFAAIVFVFTEQVVAAFTTDPEIVPTVCNYVRITILSVPFVVTRVMCAAVFNSLGDTKTPMVAVLVIDIVNLGLGYILIFVANWDYYGAAIAILAAEISGSAFLAFMLARNKIFREAGRTEWKLKSKESIKQTFVKAIPIAIEDGFWQIAAILLARFLLYYGATTYAGFQLATSAETFTQMWIYGFSTSAAALSGKALGQKNGPLYREYFKQQCYINGAISLFMGLIMIFLPKFLMALVTNDAELTAVGVEYLIVMGIIFVPQNIQYVLKGTIYGSYGSTTPTMVIMGIGIWAVRIPLAALATYVLKLPAMFIFIAIALDQCCRCLMMALFIKKKDLMHIVERKEQEALKAAQTAE